MSVQEIESAVKTLSRPEFDELLDRLNQLREEQWDRQIAEDAKAGRLNFLLEEARKAKASSVSHRLVYGKYKNYPGRESTLDDFKDAEWNGAKV